MQVSGSTPLNVRDFFRLPPTTTEAIIFDCQSGGYGMIQFSVWDGGCLMNGARDISWLSQPKIRPFPWTWWAAAGLQEVEVDRVEIFYYSSSY